MLYLRLILLAKVRISVENTKEKLFFLLFQAISFIQDDECRQYAVS